MKEARDEIWQNVPEWSFHLLKCTSIEDNTKTLKNWHKTIKRKQNEWLENTL